MPVPISMSQNQHIQLYPCEIMSEGQIHIQIEEGAFPEREYCIRNHTGKIIRKGMVGHHTSSFSLRISGLQKGEYEFIMCNQINKFTIH